MIENVKRGGEEERRKKESVRKIVDIVEARLPSGHEYASSIQVQTVDKGEEVKWIQQGGAVVRGLVCSIAAAIDTSIPWLKWNQPTRVAGHSFAV